MINVPIKNEMKLMKCVSSPFLPAVQVSFRGKACSHARKSIAFGIPLQGKRRSDIPTIAWRRTAERKELGWTTKNLELRAKEREGWKNTGQHYALLEYKVGYD